jgi:hypothetical protein
MAMSIVEPPGTWFLRTVVTKLKNRYDNRLGFGAISDTPLGINIPFLGLNQGLWVQMWNFPVLNIAPLLEASLQSIKVKVWALGNISGNISFLFLVFIHHQLQLG